MSKRSKFFGKRWAVTGLLLALAFQCLANPVLIGEGERVPVATWGEDRLPGNAPHSDRRLMESDALRPPSAQEIDEIRGDEAVPGRRPGFDEATARRLRDTLGLPENYGAAFGQGDTLRNQLLRDFGNPSANPAGAQATGAERVRRSGATESGPGGSGPVNPVQAMLREAIENALKLVRDSVIDETEMVTFSVGGVDFNLALSGGRPLLIVNGSDVWPTILYDPMNEEGRQGPSVMASAAMQGPGGQSAAAGAGTAPAWGGAAQSSPGPSEIPPAAGSADGTMRISAKVREILTDPVTIIVALGSLAFWIAYEIASAVQERRRLRRIRREERARA